MSLIWYVKAQYTLFTYILMLYSFNDLKLYIFYVCVQLRAVQNVLRRMSKEKDESRMFNLRLAIYIWEVISFCIF